MKQRTDTTEETNPGGFSSIRLMNHERVLKQALFTRIASHKPFGLTALVQALSYSKVFIGFTAGFALALALFGTAYVGRENAALADFNPLATNQAKAKAAVQASIKQTIKLSPAEQTKASEHIQADVKRSLEEALKAPDVTVVPAADSKETEDADNDDQVVLSVNGEVLNTQVDAKKLVEANKQVRRKVQFTDKSGSTVTLGLDAKNLPILKAVETGRRKGRGLLDGFGTKNKDERSRVRDTDKRNNESESKGENH